MNTFVKYHFSQDENPDDSKDGNKDPGDSAGGAAGGPQEQQQQQENTDKIEVVVYFKRYIPGLHIFELTEEEVIEFENRYKDKEVLIMRSPVSISDYLTGKRSYESCLRDAVPATLLAPLEFCTKSPLTSEEAAAEVKETREKLQEVLAALAK